MIMHWKDKHGIEFSVDTETAPLKELREAQRAFRTISHLREVKRSCSHNIEPVTREWATINDAIASRKLPSLKRAAA
jgi:hypothetical protein